MTYYEGNLPHWHPEEASLFATWTLHGAYDKFRTHRVEDAIQFGDRQPGLYTLIAYVIMSNHWARTDRELQKIIVYVERNPVRAGLVGSVEDWFWSSVSSKYNTGKNACAT